VHLASLAGGLEGLIEPSKVYGIMAAGRPTLFVGTRGSEVAGMLEREGCGEVIAPGDVGALAGRIAALADDPSVRDRMGHRARVALVSRHDRTVAADRFATLLGTLANVAG